MIHDMRCNIQFYSHKESATEYVKFYVAILSVKMYGCSCQKLDLYVPLASECSMCDVVKKLVFVKWLVFSGQPVSQGEEVSAWLICAAGTRHKQRRLPMSNVTALISFQCRPGITAGARDRHTSLLHRIRLPGDSASHKSTGYMLMESIATCHYWVL